MAAAAVAVRMAMRLLEGGRATRLLSLPVVYFLASSASKAQHQQRRKQRSSIEYPVSQGF
jgi:hypothetical protein